LNGRENYFVRKYPSVDEEDADLVLHLVKYLFPTVVKFKEVTRFSRS